MTCTKLEKPVLQSQKLFPANSQKTPAKLVVCLVVAVLFNSCFQKEVNEHLRDGHYFLPGGGFQAKDSKM